MAYHALSCLLSSQSFCRQIASYLHGKGEGPTMKGCHAWAKKLLQDLKWGAFDHPSHAPPIIRSYTITYV